MLTSQTRHLLEVQSPGALRYILGVLLMLVGVVLPLAHALIKRKSPLTTRPLRSQP